MPDNPAISRVITSERQAETLREMKDGTKMSLQERLDYAINLIPPKLLSERTGRSRKQLRRYVDGADVPMSVLTMLSVYSGVPVDWLAAGRPTFGPSEFDLWRLSLAPDFLRTSPARVNLPKDVQLFELEQKIPKHGDIATAGSDFGVRAPNSEAKSAAPTLFSIVDMDLMAAAIDGATALFTARHAELRGRDYARVICLLYDEARQQLAAQQAPSEARKARETQDQPARRP
jgi:hypothetical protein